MKIFVGIDNSNLTHSVNIIDEMGREKKYMVIENNSEGFEKLLRVLKEYTKENLYIGFEISHGPLVDFLRFHKFKLYHINPLSAKRFKETECTSGNKTDKIDSQALAKYLMLRHKNLSELLFSSKEVEKLNIYRISYARLSKDHTRLTNRLTFLLRQYFPLLDGLFSRSGSKILLKLILRYPCWEALRLASQDELTVFFKKNHYCVPRYIKRVLEKIEAHKQLISPAIEEAYQLEAQSLAQTLLLLKEQLSAVESKMQEITNEHSLGKVFLSLPGAGKLLSAKILAVLGDNKNKFQKSNNMQCLFGTAPKNYASGNYSKVTMRKACNKAARNVLYEFAFSSLQYCSWARSCYDNYRARGKTHSVAIRSLSNKWLKVIFVLWKNEKIYEEEKINFKVA